MESNVVNNNQESMKTSKRPRVGAACDECRSRKIKCDGRKPVCSPCSRKNGSLTSCYWGMRKRRGPALSKMKEQCHGLEHEQADQHAEPSPSPSPESPCTESDHGSTVNAMMGLMEEDLQTSPNASMSSFMHQIRSVMIQKTGTLQQRRSPKTCTHAIGDHRRPTSRSLFDMDFVLPPRQTADHLMEAYWRFVAPMYPFLDRDEVYTLYNALWTGESLGESGPIFLCALNALFSLTCLSDPSIKPEDRVPRGEIFYKRARASLDIELIQSRSVLAVQCFLLLGQYLQSTDESQECWYFIGLAVRTAQGIGLDLPSISARAENEKRKNLLQRVWYGCILMDRALSIVFGRPGIITYRPIVRVPLPEPHFDNSECSCLTGAPSPEPDFKGTHFFIESVKLYEMLGGTLLTLYCPGVQDEGPNDDPYAPYFGSRGIKAAQTILDVDSKLWLWHQNLPLHLRHDKAVEKSATHTRQSNILYLRYCHVRVSLFRPVLSRLCSHSDSHSESSTSAMWYKLAIHCSTICVETACEIIHFLVSTMEGKSLSELDVLLPSWWYSTYYVYTAGMVLLAASLHPKKTTEVDELTITNGWKSAIRVLRRFEPFGNHIKQSITSLITIFDRVTHRRGHEESGQQKHHSSYHQTDLRNRQRTSKQTQSVQKETDTVNVSTIDGDIHAELSSETARDQIPVDISLNTWLEDPCNTVSEVDALHLDGFFTIPDFELDPNDMSWLQMPFTLGTT
ncbi:fungal-specific transcription factor domain-containing protein [Xylogone sp. PMI_703]|nr:fungal-specific transcription factor domain-containing protein [Xylogone sp. PMI_703]